MRRCKSLLREAMKGLLPEERPSIARDKQGLPVPAGEVVDGIEAMGGEPACRAPKQIKLVAGRM